MCGGVDKSEQTWVRLEVVSVGQPEVQEGEYEWEHVSTGGSELACQLDRHHSRYMP